MFLRHNEALFLSIAEESGSALIVDSSKSLPRLSRLLMVEAQGLISYCIPCIYTAAHSVRLTALENEGNPSPSGIQLHPIVFPDP